MLSKVSSKDSGSNIPASVTVLSPEEEKQKANIHVSLLVYLQPKDRAILLHRLGESRAPADGRSMEAFPKVLVCSQGPQAKVLTCLVASKIKIFRKEKMGKERKILLLQEPLQLEENTIF